MLTIPIHHVTLHKVYKGNSAQCKSYTKNPKSLIAHTGQIFYMITFNSQNPHTTKEKNCNNLKRSHPYTPFHALLVSLRG